MTSSSFRAPLSAIVCGRAPISHAHIPLFTHSSPSFHELRATVVQNTASFARKSSTFSQNTPTFFTSLRIIFFAKHEKEENAPSFARSVSFFCSPIPSAKQFSQRRFQKLLHGKDCIPAFSLHSCVKFERADTCHCLFCRNRGHSHFFSSPIPIFGNKISYRPQKNKS